MRGGSAEGKAATRDTAGTQGGLPGLWVPVRQLVRGAERSKPQSTRPGAAGSGRRFTGELRVRQQQGTGVENGVPGGHPRRGRRRGIEQDVKAPSTDLLDAP